MIATALVAARAETARPGLDYLLLGDLRELLEEPLSGMRDRWLLATLDLLLMSRPRSESTVRRPAFAREHGEDLLPRSAIPGVIPFGKLQRLRDRIVHRAPCAELVQELKYDLRLCFE